MSERMRESPPELTVHRAERCIRFGAAVLDLGSSDFELLAALVEMAGASMTSTHLDPARAPADVWRAVERINLALAAFGDEAGFISYAPESGFMLNAPAPAPAGLQPGSKLIGRDADLHRIAGLFPARRAISIVGPGGIGKTTLAAAAAQGMRAAYRDGVHFVDLSPLSDGRLVPSAVASSLGLQVTEGPARLLAQLRHRQLLVVLDSCEHLAVEVASLIESILHEAAAVHVIATSREPLRFMDEKLYALGPLALPPRMKTLTAAAASSYAGIQLFIERAQLSAPSFEITDASAASIAQLCQRLDGLPLAIELAAAGIATLGVAGVVSQLEDRLQWLRSDTGAAPSRHRTLEALLDWSYQLLSPSEQIFFRRLSAFRGGFSLSEAVAVAADEAAGPEGSEAATEGVLDLVAKSLLSSTPDEDCYQLRLLDTTRAYAAAKLALDADGAAVHRRHAVAMSARLTQAELAWERMASKDWRMRFADAVNDVGAALAWSLEAPGETLLALNLTSQAFQLADQTSLIPEYASWADRALAALPKLQPRNIGLEVRLRTLPVFLQQRMPGESPATLALMRDILQLAKTSPDARLQAGPLIALWGVSYQKSDYLAALLWSEQLQDASDQASDPFLGFLARRTGAQANHYLGDHALAMKMAQAVLASATQRLPLAYFPSPVDPRVSMQIVLIRILWLQGDPRQALELLSACLDFASSDTPMGLCQALALAAIPVALWSGDVEQAGKWVAQLRELEATYVFGYWRFWWRAYQDLLAFWSGEAAFPEDLEAWSAQHPIKLRDQLASIDMRLMSAETEARSGAGTLGWCAPEILRAKAAAARQQAAAGADDAAIGLLQRALRLARSQGALAWELRASIDLADLWKARREDQAAFDLLQEVRSRHAEGASTIDLRAADSRLLAWRADLGGA